MIKKWRVIYTTGAKTDIKEELRKFSYNSTRQKYKNKIDEIVETVLIFTPKGIAPNNTILNDDYLYSLGVRAFPILGTHILFYIIKDNIVYILAFVYGSLGDYSNILKSRI